MGHFLSPRALSITMPTHRPKINGAVLRWAREQAMMTVEHATRIASVPSVAHYERIEAGENYPTSNQLHELARALRRPVGFFHLQEVPTDEPAVFGSFRRRPEAPSPAAFAEFKALSIAESRREVALDAIEDLGITVPRLDTLATTRDSPAVVANSLRNFIGLSDDYRRFRSAEDAYLTLRVAVEAAGVLVFHFTLPSASGFALARDVLPVIGISTSERSGEARQFTLAHELGHVVLGKSTFHTSQRSLYDYNAAEERWCNLFAGNFLVPSEAISANAEVQRRGESAPWSIEEIKEVARSFRVSPAMFARRLQETGYLHPETAAFVIPTIDGWWTKRKEVVDIEIEAGEPKTTRADFWPKTLAEWGYFLPNLLGVGYREGVISAAELTEIVGFKIATSLKLIENSQQRARSALSL